MTEAVTLYATNPAAMALAQKGLIDWCENKEKQTASEIMDLSGVRDTMILAQLNTRRVSNALMLAGRRLSFYKKMRAALAAGYYILPPMDAQWFALRTNRALPPRKRSRWWWDGGVGIPSLPLGEGGYVNASPIREVTNEQTETASDGTKRAVSIKGNVAWQDEVEFPFFPVKPRIIEATAKALGEKIFDALGVMPQTVTADPMLLGMIKHWKPGRDPLNFFIAWWLDLDML